MKTFATWLVPLIALTAACAALAQEQLEVPLAEMPPVGGCGAFGCESDTIQATTDEFATPGWQAFQISPDNWGDPLLIRQESPLFDPAEYNRTNAFPLVREERTWTQKISRIKELPLLTLWQTSGSKIFLGVNSDGFAGLNFSQKIRENPTLTGSGSDSPASRPIGPLSPPLVHAQSLTYEKRDLSESLDAETR